MKRNPVVSSSNIKSIGIEEGVMEIEFFGGRVYRYTGPKVQAHYDGLTSAKSIGKYFANEVRFCPETACEQVTPADSL